MRASGETRLAVAPRDGIVQRLPVEPPFRSFPSQQSDHSFLDAAHVRGIDQPAELAAVNRIDRSISISREHRGSASERFQEGNAEAFARARHRKYVGQAIVVCELVLFHEPGHRDGALRRRVVRHCLDAGRIAASADQDIAHRAARRTNPRERLKHTVVPFIGFPRIEACDGEDDAFVAPEVVALHELLRFSATVKRRSSTVFGRISTRAGSTSTLSNRRWRVQPLMTMTFRRRAAPRDVAPGASHARRCRAR